MNTSLPSVLVIGCGSIGERHLRTFLATRRVNVVACDSRPEIRQGIGKKYQVETLSDWSKVIGSPAFVAVVVATPAPSHVGIAIKCLEAGHHVLIEKPLALALEGIDALVGARDKARRFAGVGYVLHFAPALQAARRFLTDGSLGPIKHVAVTSGQFFPKFRPAYREIYYRDREQGRGAIQDALTHLANAVEWVVGPTTRVTCDAAHQVLEGVEVEDTVNAMARNGNVLVSYGLNQFQAPNETRLDFHAMRGSVRIELHHQRWGVCTHSADDWAWHAAPVADRDQLFVSQAQAFLDGCDGAPQEVCTIEEARQTLRFNIAALKSWSDGNPQDL